MAAVSVQKTALRSRLQAVRLAPVKTLAARLSILLMLVAPAALAAPKHGKHDSTKTAQTEARPSKSDQAKADKADADAGDGVKTHVVAPGQTIGKIAKRYHVSVEQLRETNDLRPGTTLKPGTRLTIPSDDVPTDRTAKKGAHGKHDDDHSTPRAKAGQDRNDRDAEGDAAAEPSDEGKGKKGKKGHAKAADADEESGSGGSEKSDKADKKSHGKSASRGKSDKAHGKAAAADDADPSAEEAPKKTKKRSRKAKASG